MMNWSQQAEGAMSAWLQMQKQMMDNWQQMMGLTTPAGNNMAGVMAQQMMGAQAMSMRLMETMMNTWALMGDPNQDPATLMQQQMERVREEVMDAMTDSVKVSESMAEMWKAYVEQSQAWFTPWMGAMQGMAEQMPGMMSGDPSAYMAAADTYWNAYDTTLGQVLRSPGVGLTRELDEKVRGSFAAWMDLQQAAYDYQVMLADGWVKAFQQMMTTMMAAPPGGTLTVRTFIDHWSTTADEVFKDIFRTDNFVEMQGRYVNAMMAFRLKQREVTEAYLRYNDMPTRTEIDEAHKRIYELSRTVKALQREVETLKAEAAPPPKKTTPRKKATKKQADAAEVTDEADRGDA